MWIQGLALPRALCAALMLSACSEPSAAKPSATDVIDTQATSAVDELLLVLDIEVVESGATAPSYLAPMHVREVTLEVDGEFWGDFPLEPAGESSSEGRPVGNFITHPEKRSALLVARTSGALFDEEKVPATAGDWAALLRRFLLPGGHVATLRIILLRDSQGADHVLSPGLLLPFTVEAGAHTAFLGNATVEMPAEAP